LFFFFPPIANGAPAAGRAHKAQHSNRPKQIKSQPHQGRPQGISLVVVVVVDSPPVTVVPVVVAVIVVVPVTTVTFCTAHRGPMPRLLQTSV